MDSWRRGLEYGDGHGDMDEAVSSILAALVTESFAKWFLTYHFIQPHITLGAVQVMSAKKVFLFLGS